MTRLILALLAVLIAPVYAQDVSNPQCNGPWISYTSTITAQTPGVTPPTFTLNGARYKLCGNKTVMLAVDVSVTAAGTGSGAILYTLPFSARTTISYSGSAFEYAALGIVGATFIGQSTPTLGGIKSAVATTPFIVAGQAIAGSIVYEIP